MSAYFIANIKIHNEEEYKKYLNEVDEVFAKYKGSYLALDDNPVVLEGSGEYSRIVLIKFESREDFNEWYNSDDYQRILKHRLTGADCNSILINGK